MHAFREFHDLSLRLGAENAAYPGDPPYHRRLVSSLERGDACDVSALELCAHTGTHLDFPAHYLPQGPNLDQYAVDRFLLPALVVEAKGPGPLGPKALKSQTCPRGGALLFKTANSTKGLAAAGIYRRDYVHLSPELAQACLESGAAMVGLDYLSVDGPEPNDHPVHRLLLLAGVLILEGINLARVAPGQYTLICLPLKLAGAEAAPARALLAR